MSSEGRENMYVLHVFRTFSFPVALAHRETGYCEYLLCVVRAEYVSRIRLCFLKSSFNKQMLEVLVDDLFFRDSSAVLANKMMAIVCVLTLLSLKV